MTRPSQKTIAKHWQIHPPWLHVPRSKHLVQVLLAILLSSMYILMTCYLTRQPPDLLSTASLLTERVDFVVGDGAKAAFPVDGMRISAEGSPVDGQCVKALLTPLPNAVVQYARVGGGPLSIKIYSAQSASPPIRLAILSPDSGPALSLTGTIYLEAAGCADAATTLLPIWGQLSIGREFAPIAQSGPREPSLLLSGTLRVMARSIIGSKLYQVADLTLPVGSRLAAGAGRPADRPINWWGAAYIDPQKPALVAEVASNARQLVIYRPDAGDADTVDVSALEQLFSDPYIVWCQIAFGILFVLCQLAGFIAEWHGTRFDRTENHATDAKEHAL